LISQFPRVNGLGITRFALLETVSLSVTNTALQEVSSHMPLVETWYLFLWLHFTWRNSNTTLL